MVAHRWQSKNIKITIIIIIIIKNETKNENKNIEKIKKQSLDKKTHKIIMAHECQI